MICKSCCANDVSEDTFSGIAPEIVKKRLRDKVATRAPASNVQLVVRDNFSSGTPAPAHRTGQAGGVPHNLFGGGFAGHGNPDPPQLMTHYGPALQPPLDFEKQVQMEVSWLYGARAGDVDRVSPPHLHPQLGA